MKAIFLEKRAEAQGITTFVFRPEKPVRFEAGQFAFFNFKLNGKEFSKHFTISNAPTRELIEMTTILSGSDYKNALDSLQPGQLVELAGPMGEFTLKKAKDKKIVFLCGGIGITPARSILEFLADSKQNREIVLFYSNRNIERIAFRQELERLQKKIFGLKIVHTLTDLSEEEKKNWNRETGVINKLLVEKHSGELKNAVFFVVGPPKFVEAMNSMLKKDLKIPAKNIAVENFSGY